LKPERKLWQKIKKFMPEISFTRLENLSGFGTPDLLAYNKNHTFFTIELKVAKGNKIKFSPHQISFHVKHPHNTFILVSSERDKTIKLYEGTRISLLVTQGLKLEACRSGLDLIYNYLQRL
jgi:Holliday junction resolvase